MPRVTGTPLVLMASWHTACSDERTDIQKLEEAMCSLFQWIIDASLAD
jgi:hypothetical protein